MIINGVPIKPGEELDLVHRDPYRHLFTVTFESPGSRWEIHYRSIRQCLDDPHVGELFSWGCKASVWSGDVRVSSAPIVSAASLRASVVANARAILHRLL